jgi:hypothetical protein
LKPEDASPLHVTSSVALFTGERDSIPPNFAKAVEALRSIGYSFEQAVADIVDNSIDAHCTSVLIRFVIGRRGELRLAIVDDGYGMNVATMVEAMRIGSDTNQNSKGLGKYGLGLKLATLSHARNLTVVSRCNRKCNGRRITVEGLKAGGYADHMSEAAATQVMDTGWGPVNTSDHGTVIFWDAIDRIRITEDNLELILKRLRRKLQTHLGMCFHRFLASGKLRVFHDRQDPDDEQHSIVTPVRALDPFGYPSLGKAGYPQKFRFTVPGLPPLSAEFHIWPANSEVPEYRLDGASARQGFYFYRNDRLIQAGGWNGLRETQDAHLSLARILIELPSGADSEFSLDVKKSGVTTPPAFQLSVQKAVSTDNKKFEACLREAEAVYRKKEADEPKSLPMVPREGVPRALHRLLAGKLAGKNGRFRTMDFVWQNMEPDRFFEVDRENARILLNKRFRHIILQGSSGSRADAPLLKLLLYFLLREELDTYRISHQRKDWLDSVNDSLCEAVEWMGLGDE